MLKMMIVALGVVGFSSVAQAQDRTGDTYDVRARSNGETLQIGFRTNEVFDSRCRLVVEEVRIRDVQEDNPGAVGIDTSIGECSEEAGPHVGRLALDLETELAPGRYLLVIDGSIEGKLYVSPEGAVRLREADAEQL